MIAIKVCGICNLEDAEKSVELGADYLGLIFAESPRQIQPADARQIKRKFKGQVKLVGVFKDQDSRFVNDTSEVVGLDFVQLHGKESPDFCRQINYPIIKVIEIDSDDNDFAATMPEPDEYSVHAYLFDRPKTMKDKADWLRKIVDKYSDGSLEKYQPFFLAGGLNADNVALACQLNPFGVDVASGVEAEAGKKDHKRLEAFFQAVQGAKSC